MKRINKCIAIILIFILISMNLSVYNKTYAGTVVTISYNGQVVDSFCGIGAVYENNASYYGVYQCNEYVSRFYSAIYGVTVSNMFYGATPLANGVEMLEVSTPQAGDVGYHISYDSNGDPGPHWFIIKSVSGNTATIIEQNWKWAQNGLVFTEVNRTVTKGSTEGLRYFRVDASQKTPDGSSSNSARIALDTVAEGATYIVGINDDNRIHIDGWATTDVEGAFVQIYVDDNLAVAAHNVERYDRPDVSSKSNVGYSAYYDYSGLSEGTHTLRVSCHEPTNGNILASKIVDFNIIHADIAIDSVTEGKTYYKASEESKNQMTISGWAVARYRESFVQIYIDNELAIATHLIEREQRPDIIGYDNAGYTATFNYSGLTEGEHILKVIEFEEGTNQVLVAEERTFTIVEKDEYDLGDINADGEINARDAKLAIQHFTGKTVLTDEQIARGDVYADGDINARDAKLIIQFFTGKISGF